MLRPARHHQLGLVVLLLAACTGTPSDDAPSAARPVVRLTDGRFELRPGTGVRVRRPVGLAGVHHPAFTSAGQSGALAKCTSDAATPETHLACEAVVPPARPAAPVGGLALVGPGDPTSGERTAIALPVDTGRARFTVAASSGPLGRAFRLLRAPALSHRTLRTEEVSVPPEATLRFSLGVEEPAWRTDSAPVRFGITAGREGLDLDLFEATLDPARVPADRTWRDFEVSLAELAGQTVRFQFSTRPANAHDLRPSLPLWGDPTLFAPAERPAGPDLLVVSLAPPTPTAALDTLAREGATFLLAWRNSPTLSGAHASLFTGLLPHRTGVIGRNRLETLARPLPLLAQDLRRAGYRTAAFSSDPKLDPGAGFAAGFELWVDEKGLRGDGEREGGALGAARAWVARAPAAGPWFVFVRTAATDRELLEFVKDLTRDAGRSGLLLAAVADPGPPTGGPGAKARGPLADAMLRVPVILHWPGTLAPGLRITSPTSLADLTPTLLDLAGLDDTTPRDGTSLAGLLDPTREPPAEREFIAYEGPGGAVAVRSSMSKCVAVSPKAPAQCWDLGRDPEETQPLQIGPGHPLARLRDAAAGLAREFVSRQELAPPTGSATPATTPTPQRSGGPFLIHLSGREPAPTPAHSSAVR